MTQEEKDKLKEAILISYNEGWPAGYSLDASKVCPPDYLEDEELRALWISLEEEINFMEEV